MKKSKKPFSRMKKTAGGLFGRAKGYVKDVGRQADEVMNAEPIDFSAPSPVLAATPAVYEDVLALVKDI